MWRLPTCQVTLDEGVRLCRESSWWCRACAHPPGFSTKSCWFFHPPLQLLLRVVRSWKERRLPLRMCPGKLLGSLTPPKPLPGSFLGGSVHPSGASGIPSASLPKSLVQRVSPKGLCCYGTIIYGLKLGNRWCFYIDHTGWIPARDLGVLFVFTCSLSDGNISAGPPWS